jgi:hypothetical protein
MRAENVTVHDLRIKHVAALLKTSDSSHDKIWDFRYTIYNLRAPQHAQFTRRIANRKFKDDGLPLERFTLHCRMHWLTKQEQLVVVIVIGLLLTGFAVKFYRTAHPDTTARQPAKN